MGVSAVPGSGKTAILSYLAARLVREKVRGDEEVLIVTFANSAVDNFSRRIKEFLQDTGEHAGSPLLPDVGYRVRTLHGLAHDILRERPALLGLPEDFSIIDERVSDELLDDIVVNWIKSNPIVFEAFVDASIDESRRKWLSREKWPALVKSIARSFIRRAKDLQMTPRQVRDGLPSTSGAWLIGRLGADIYEDYERALSFRGGIDFDDLIRLALLGLQTDPQLLARLQARWPYILEDEAQDSSELQEKILRLLTHVGNWVRVGDPNQSINTTFTTSDIRYLVEFLAESDVEERPIIHSGRSSQRIIDLANFLVDWTIDAHPSNTIRASAFRAQHVVPTPPGDPQPNPIDEAGDVVTLYNKPLNPDQELDLVVKSIGRWLPDHQDRTVAVLVPDNQRGFKIAEQLKANDIPYEEMLRSTSSTRAAARALSQVLRYLAAPLSGPLLSKAYEALFKQANDTEESDQVALDDLHKTIVASLRHCEKVETYLWPRPDLDWLAEYKPAVEDQIIRSELIVFRKAATHWLDAAAQLPIDQLILTVAQDLYRSADLDRAARDLALAHKIALVLRQIANEHSEYRLPDLASELDRVANNEQRFIGFGEDDLGFNPRAGRVTVATMHKAKGLEWDRVYLLGVNNYDFPSAESHDVYRGETWYIRDQLNLEAEAIGQVEAINTRSSYLIGVATEKARIDYVAERLRLLYVGITRAKRELILTWNTGSFENEPKQPAAPFIALNTYAEKKSDAD